MAVIKKYSSQYIPFYNSFQRSRMASERQKPKHGVTYAKKSLPRRKAKEDSW